MKKTCAFFYCLTFISCSSTQFTKSEHLKKVSLKSKKADTSLYFKKYTPKTQRRSIASTTEEVSTKNKYFLSLYGQYEAINKLTGSKNKINACPQFHHEMVTSKKPSLNIKNIKSINFMSFKSSPNSLATLPSLALNYKNQEVFAYLSKKNLWNKADKVMKRALKAHNEINLNEINELCDQGSSDGFYAYQNMVSFYSEKGFAMSQKSMPAFLKIPVLANILILHNYMNDFSEYEKQVISSLNINWFTDYLDELKKSTENRVEYLTKR